MSSCAQCCKTFSEVNLKNMNFTQKCVLAPKRLMNGLLGVLCNHFHFNWLDFELKRHLISCEPVLCDFN